jgi:hypothetical protein
MNTNTAFLSTIIPQTIQEQCQRIVSYVSSFDLGEIIALFIFGIWIVGSLAFTINVFMSIRNSNATYGETIEEDILEELHRKFFTDPAYSEFPENMWHKSEDL